MRPLPASHAHPSLQMFQGVSRGSTGLMQGVGRSAQGRGAKSLGEVTGHGGKGMGQRPQAASVTDLLCNPNSHPSLDLTLPSATQEGWVRQFYPTTCTKHLLHAAPWAGPQGESSKGDSFLPALWERNVCEEGRHHRVSVRTMGPGSE